MLTLHEFCLKSIMHMNVSCGTAKTPLSQKQFFFGGGKILISWCFLLLLNSYFCEYDFSVKGIFSHMKFPSLCSCKIFPQPFLLDAAYSIIYLSELKLEKLYFLTELQSIDSFPSQLNPYWH
jgi:hypothetical protein